MAKQTEQISETDLSGELQSSKAQLRRLTKAQAEAEERVTSTHTAICVLFQLRVCLFVFVLCNYCVDVQESDWRRKFEKLMKDYDKLSGTMGETVLAMEWRERYAVSCELLLCIVVECQ